MLIKLKNIFYGFVIGVSMLIPGVSGGSVAVLLGIYDDLLSAVSCLFKDFRKNFLLLCCVAAGGTAGFFAMAGCVRMLLDRYYLPTIFFFLGVVISGVILYTKTTVNKYKKISVPMILVGLAFVVLIKLMPMDIISIRNVSLPYRFVGFVFLGLLLAVALILPGISFSLMLVIIGLYDQFIAAIQQFDLRFLVPLGLCVLFGIIVCSKGLHWFLQKRPMQCRSVILGFVIASVFQMFPEIPEGTSLLYCLVLLAVGLSTPLLVTYVIKKNG